MKKNWRRIAHQLHQALKDAADHLDYCGYGDEWERECAEGLKEEIEKALTLMGGTNGKKK